MPQVFKHRILIGLDYSNRLKMCWPDPFEIPPKLTLTGSLLFDWVIPLKKNFTLLDICYYPSVVHDYHARGNYYTLRLRTHIEKDVTNLKNI